MKSINTLLFLLLVSSSTIAQAPNEKALLWKISGNGISQPSYLYGTIHLMCPEQIKIDSVLKRSFSTCKQLYLEINTSDPEMMTKAMNGMMMDSGQSLENLVSKADYDSMSHIYMDKASIPMVLMAKAKPMLLMSAVFPSLLGCAPEGWETRFEEMAKDRKMPIKGLETVEYQLRVFDTIPYKVQANMLKDFLYNLDSTKKGFEEMLDIYLKKDINALYQMTVKEPDLGNYDALMLNNRNNNWIPVIAAAAKEKPTFFAVGAAHLGGENGVISLLRKQAFKVLPVM
jgi:uncharacterized protein YbaP (TraB family)